MSGAETHIRAGLESLHIMDAGCASISPHSSGLFQIYLIRPGSSGNSKHILTNSATRTSHSGEIIAKPLPIEMAEAEWDGLMALRQAGARTPTLYGIYKCEDPPGPGAAGSVNGSPNQREAILFMQYCGGHPQNASTLKSLYATRQEYWGYSLNNFIGRLNQNNSRHKSFEEFWWLDRIEPQLRLAREGGLLNSADSKTAEHLVTSLSQQWNLNKCGPRLIHGDLWNGNVLGDESGEAVLIDPSVSFAHPEQDLAMLELFGSPISETEIEAIARAAGLDPGRKERVPFFQLYPLLVHVNLFGQSYVSGVRRVLKQYV